MNRALMLVLLAVIAVGVFMIVQNTTKKPVPVRTDWEIM
jgi:hypothetical protein